MKIYTSSKSGLSVLTKEGVKRYSPFYFIPDSDDISADTIGLEDAGEIFDIEALKEISAEIKAYADQTRILKENVANISGGLSCQITNLATVQDSINSDIRNLYLAQSDINQSLQSALKTAAAVSNIEINAETEVSKFREAVRAIKKDSEDSIQSIAEKISEEMKEVADKIEEAQNNSSLQAERLIKETEEKLKTYANQCENFTEKARKWAENPPNVAVEDGEFSAKHYAELIKFNEGSQQQ